MTRKQFRPAATIKDAITSIPADTSSSETSAADAVIRGDLLAARARRAGLHACTVNLVENNKILGYPSQLQKLARALGISRRELERLLETGSRKSGRARSARRPAR
jgi:hypothetical protein